MTMLTVADLDVDRVYWGVTQKAAEDIAAGDVVFKAEQIAPQLRVEGVWYIDGDCDLARGRYRWSPELRRFDPLGRFAQTRERTAPVPERALYEIILAWPGTVPDYAKQWADWYQLTIDNG